MPHQDIFEALSEKQTVGGFIFGLAMEAFHRGYSSRNSGFQLVRSLGMNHMQENDHLKRLAISIAAGGFFKRLNHEEKNTF